MNNSERELEKLFKRDQARFPKKDEADLGANRKGLPGAVINCSILPKHSRREFVRDIIKKIESSPTDYSEEVMPDCTNVLPPVINFHLRREDPS